MCDDGESREAWPEYTRRAEEVAREAEERGGRNEKQEEALLDQAPTCAIPSFVRGPRDRGGREDQRQRSQDEWVQGARLEA
mmetsp:Transcript_68155/g.195553  ORF Transcript_68155/g.195553 Transcript_68155/m.195553 type:complete len:81 (+) Transcript_68155:1143-1385(+)